MKVVYNEKFDTNDRIFDLESVIERLLPHGSGINCDWSIQQDKSGNIYCHNAYTCYTEHGMLDSYCDFYIKIKLVNLELHIVDLHFSNSKAQKLNQKYMLREYLEQLFFDPASMQAIAITNNAKINISEYL